MDKRNVIFQLDIGHQPEYKPAIDSVRNYCNKYGIEHVISDAIRIKAFNFYFEKMQIYFLTDFFNQALYLDADVLVTPNAPNIFEVYNDPYTFYAYHESAPTPTMDRNPVVEKIISNTEKEWPRDSNGQYQYFNAGIFLTSKQTALVPGNLPVQNPAIFEFGDQTALNFLVVDKGFAFQSLDYKWNRMHLGQPDPEGKRFEAFFIHYAGPDVYGSGNKAQIIADDYKRLYD